MWKKWIVAVIGFVALMSTAFADVDANKADQVALDGLRGLGPAKSKAIIEERTKMARSKIGLISKNVSKVLVMLHPLVCPKLA
jgi:competence protein ComEA